MITTTQRPDGLVSLDTDNDHILHRIGSDSYSEMHHTTVHPDHVADYEEVAVADIPPYSEAEYKAKVAQLVHERYSMDDEIALAANANSPMILADEDKAAAIAEEYAAYQAYRAECKARAKAILSNPIKTNKTTRMTR